MPKRRWPWMLATLSLLAATAAILLTPGYRFYQAERELNRLYASTRPVSYRWSGAPPVSQISGFLPPVLAGSESDRVRLLLLRLQPRFSNDPRWLGLMARLSLWSGQYGAAVGQYRRAILSGGRELEAELAVAFVLRAEADRRPSDFGLALEYCGRALRHPAVDAATRFNAALVLESAGLFSLAEDQWTMAIAAEPDKAWRSAAQKHSAQLLARLASRAEATERVQHPETLDAAGLTPPAALETAQEAAIEDWIARDAPPEAALRLLAREFEQRHGDVWWRDFLSRPVSKEALRMLSESARAYRAGRFADAERFGVSAEEAFARLGNPAGRLRARFQRITASHRGDDPSRCPDLINGFAEEARHRSWKWLLASSWLDGITCRNLLYRGASLEDREKVLHESDAMGFEGVSLRALAFLTEPQVTAGSPLRVWGRGFEGLNRLWASLASDYRLHHFLWCLSEIARISDEPEAAVLLRRESARHLEGEADPGLRAIVIGDLAASESRVGLFSNAAAHLGQAATATAENVSALPDRYTYEIEDQLAQAEIAAGKAEAAIQRLNHVLASGTLRRPPGDMERAELVETLGSAFLQAKHYGEARQRFEESIAINRGILDAPGEQLERESVQRLYEAGFRGLTEADLRLGMSPEAALQAWEGFRSKRWRPGAPAKPERVKVAQRPRAGTVKLTYALLPDGVSVWLSDARGVEQRWLPADAVRAATATLVGLVSDPAASRIAVQPAARRAGELLLGQFESRLVSRHGVAELLIDADDSLSSMPWAVTELSGRRLVEQFALVMTAGFASTSHAPTAIGPASRVAVFANPDVGGLRAEFPPLPDADREAEMIGGFFRSVALRRGAAANREAFLRMAPFADVLHFAGHGVANGGFGGLLVGGEPPFLTAEQIARLDLSRLDLVVLAACSSGLGEETASVNADTLVRGFLDAGAARVLASSWDVSSVSTSRLMRRFYAEMLRGLGPAAALRQAMIALAASGANPYEWAAFQLYGAP